MTILMTAIPDGVSEQGARVCTRPYSWSRSRRLVTWHSRFGAESFTHGASWSRSRDGVS